MDRFVEWTGDNQLLLNVDKTKYLGVTIDNQLNWRANSTAVYKKGCSRLHFLRKLRSFSVCSKMLEIIHQSVIASTLCSSMVCLGSSITASDTSRLNKLIRKAGSVIGCRQETFEAVMERCYPSWTSRTTLFTTHWTDSGASSPRDSDSFAV